MKKNYKKILCIIMSCSIIMSNLCIFANTALAEENKEIKSNDYLIYAEDEKEYNKILDRYEEYISDDSENLQYLKENKIVNLQLSDSQIKTIKKSNDTVKVEEDVVLTGSETAYEAATKPIEQWNLDMIGAEDVDTITSGSHAKIAIIDTGVCASEEIPIAGRINLVPGEEEVSPLYEDISGHGTSIASIINARDNDKGITGVNPNAEVYSVKALDDGKSAPLSRIIEGIYWCIDNGMNVINMSFGTSADSSLLHQAIIDAYNSGILMIASAGNNSNGGIEYPAAYNEVVAVGSIDNNAEISDFSATGKELEIVAPGEEIAATGFFDEVVKTDGTSVATAQVTGVASLLWDRDISKDADFIRALLVSSARPLGDESVYGSGVVDAEYALNHYDEFAESYTPQMKEVKTMNNIDPVETCTDDEVRALWSSSDHKPVVNEHGYTGDKEMLVKFGCKMSDLDFFKDIIYEDSPSGVTRDAANHQFHGYDNFVANYIFLARYAFNLKNDSLPVNKYSLYPVSNFAGSYVERYKTKYKTADKTGFVDYLVSGMSKLRKNWNTVYENFYEDATGKNASKNIGPSSGHNSLLILGMAIHCAMDAYENSSVQYDISLYPYEFKYFSDSQNTQNYPKRYEAAKAVGLAILDKWDANQGNFELSEFYQPIHPNLSSTQGFCLVNFFQNVIDVKPNLQSINATKYQFFADRSAIETIVKNCKMF